MPTRYRRQTEKTHVYEILNPLLDNGRRRSKARHELSNDLVDKLIMAQALFVFHDADNASLIRRIIVSIYQARDKPELTSIWCFLSSSTFSCVSARSSLFSTLPTIVWILIFAKGHVKLLLKLNLSFGPTSRDFGFLVKILNLAHARDCRLRRRSESGICVAALMSCEVGEASAGRDDIEGSITHLDRNLLSRF